MPPEPPPPDPVLALNDVSKRFGAVRALTGVSLALRPGRAHALLGENGAGKSTLINVLGGVHRPDQGELLVDGRATVLDGPAAARAEGIAVIHQEPALFPDLSLAENVFMGRQPLRAARHIDVAALHRATRALFDRLGVPLDPARPARGLSIADQQVVEIAKALSMDARVLVMDEPTAALTPAEVSRLFTVSRALLAQDVALLFVSHRLDEVFDLCQDATVLRDGAHVWSGPLRGQTQADLVRRMVGRELAAAVSSADNVVGAPVLEVRRLTREGVFTDITLTLHKGEILGLAGLVGAGRSEVARAIFGIDTYDAGTITLHGHPLRPGSPNAAMTGGIGLVPEDRRQQGLVLSASIQRNVALPSLATLSTAGLLRTRSEHTLAQDWAQRLRLKFAHLTDPVGRLSGGNQQKVVLAKWLARNPSVLLVDEPTRGIDVGAKAEVHRLLTELAARGVAILLISSELPEVLALSHRILVMREGRLTAELSRTEATEEAVALAATGAAVTG
ncbi:sugar ABC transporter ATP-binding protein [Crossiella equi]|nr:sugar ABC transporter ATP-binding protein [Crossiella equi]